jgi:hypothetical protein
MEMHPTSCLLLLLAAGGLWSLGCSGLGSRPSSGLLVTCYLLALRRQLLGSLALALRVAWAWVFVFMPLLLACLREGAS